MRRHIPGDEPFLRRVALHLRNPARAAGAHRGGGSRKRSSLARACDCQNDEEYGESKVNDAHTRDSCLERPNEWRITCVARSPQARQTHRQLACCFSKDHDLTTPCGGISPGAHRSASGRLPPSLILPSTRRYCRAPVRSHATMGGGNRPARRRRRPAGSPGSAPRRRAC